MDFHSEVVNNLFVWLWVGEHGSSETRSWIRYERAVVWQNV